MKKKQQEVPEVLVVRTKKSDEGLPEGQTHRLQNVELITPKKDITFQLLDNHIDTDEFKIKIISTAKWYTRLWYLISNPFLYIFSGYIRY